MSDGYFMEKSREIRCFGPNEEIFLDNPIKVIIEKGYYDSNEVIFVKGCPYMDFEKNCILDHRGELKCKYTQMNLEELRKLL